jgi:hypothetical protein
MVGVDGGPPKTRGLLVKQSKVWPNGFKLEKRREHGKISRRDDQTETKIIISIWHAKNEMKSCKKQK